MVEFQTEYYTPMDRGYHERVEFEPIRSSANIEEPIIPISQLGQTVPEHGRTQNIMQNVQAAIRAGAGNIQIVFETPIESALGGRPKAYGEEVRQAMRELALANEVAITGMEMPTSLNNMSGWDRQRNIVDEEKRQRDLDEVKDMIRFAANVAQGGGVDIVSWEYDRPVHRAQWFKEGIPEEKAFKRLIDEEKKREELFLVDKRSGALTSIPIREGIPMFLRPDGTKLTEPELWKYKEFEDFTKKELKKTEVTREEVATTIKDYFVQEQINAAIGQEAFYRERLGMTQRHLNTLKEEFEKETRPEVKQKLQEAIKEQKEILEGETKGVLEQKRYKLQLEERQKNLLPMEEYVVEKSAQSYAEAGMFALQLQHSDKNLKKPLYVGPELGWPQYFGGHPKEFVGLIRDAREVMAKKLHDEQGYAWAQAKEEAQKHIKGTFDTSHMGMWLQTFHPELPWDERLSKFKKWYNEQIDWLADVNKKEQVIGAIQAVDSAGPGHGHLPPGQGILPVKDAVEKLRKDGGFTGYIVSEGHEEEKFNQGRILLKTWQHFGSPISSSYGPGMPAQRWGDVQNSYFGRTYSPMMMFGAYAPSNEFKLWSEVPLE